LSRAISSLDRVRERLDDGDSFERAVHGAKRDYLRYQRSTFEHRRYDVWPLVGPDERPVRRGDDVVLGTMPTAR